MINTNFPHILDFLRRLADSHESPSLGNVLQQLANYFDASGIGVVSLDGFTADLASYFSETHGPESFPWQLDKQLTSRLQNSLTALIHKDPVGEWLLSLVWTAGSSEPLLAWLYRAPGHRWDEAEQMLWPCVGQTLVRWLARQQDFSKVPLRQKLEQVAVVASRLSHDFGNYLTGILGFTELSLAQVPADNLLHRYLQEVLQSARQGSDWIRRLHWFCRRTGQFSWPTELTSLLQETQMRPSQGAQLNWDKKIPHELPLLAIDATSLQAVISELVNNAREAIKGAMGNLTVSAQAVELSAVDSRSLLGTVQPGSYVEITIADDGPGFSPDARAKLFQEPFFSTKPRHRGLGFLVVYGILYRFHGGLRIAAPEGKDAQGACIQFYVPAVKVETMVPSSKETHILLVHHDPLLFESLRKILEWQGYRVTIALSAQSALSAYQIPGQSYALVLAEAMLPQLSGFDLARRILDRDPKANFLFLYTGSSFHGLGEEEMLKRFMLLRWPLQTAAFVEGVRNALTRNK